MARAFCGGSLAVPSHRLIPPDEWWTRSKQSNKQNTSPPPKSLHRSPRCCPTRFFGSSSQKHGLAATIIAIIHDAAAIDADVPFYGFRPSIRSLKRLCCHPSTPFSTNAIRLPPGWRDFHLALFTPLARRTARPPVASPYLVPILHHREPRRVYPY